MTGHSKVKPAGRLRLDLAIGVAAGMGLGRMAGAATAPDLSDPGWRRPVLERAVPPLRPVPGNTMRVLTASPSPPTGAAAAEDVSPVEPEPAPVPVPRPGPVIEIAATSGTTTEGATAAVLSTRVFGETDPTTRYAVQAAVSRRWPRSRDTDAFSALYPYGRHALTVPEAYVEKIYAGPKRLAGIRAGRFRPPFGLYVHADQAYVGFTRSPLVRYDVFSIVDQWSEGGIDVYAGRPDVYLEAVVGTPQESDGRPRGTDTVLRLQGYRGPFIAGVSHFITHGRGKPEPYAGEFRPGQRYVKEFTGFDARWLRNGIQIRGEYVLGRGTPTTYTHTAYADLLVHKPFLGSVSLVSRYDWIRVSGSPQVAYTTVRWTGGARIPFGRNLLAQLDLIRQQDLAPHANTAVDLALTYLWRR